MSTSPEEIWSTRLQKELYALTTTDNNGNESIKNIGVLPPFITVKGHELNLTTRKCTICFAIGLDDINSNSNNTDADAGNESNKDNDNQDATVKGEGERAGDESVTEGTKEEENSGDNGNDNVDDKNGQDETDKITTADTAADAPTAPTPTTIPTEVTITLDASLQYRSGSNTPDASLSYPFFKPKAFLSSGAELLSTSSPSSP